MPPVIPGEIWMVDLGYAAKRRPCVILSDHPADDELALVVVIPHTTAVRGNRRELPVPKRFLKPGLFHLQQIQPISLVRLERRLGTLSGDEFQRINDALVRLLKL